MNKKPVFSAIIIFLLVFSAAGLYGQTKATFTYQIAYHEYVGNRTLESANALFTKNFVSEFLGELLNVDALRIVRGVNRETDDVDELRTSLFNPLQQRIISDYEVKNNDLFVYVIFRMETWDDFDGYVVYPHYNGNSWQHFAYYYDAVR